MEVVVIKLSKVFEVFSDGSGTNVDSPGGYGWVVVENNIEISCGSGHMLKGSNNMAEITAAIEGLKALKIHLKTNNITDAEVILVSDSLLTLNYAKGTWKCKALHLKSLRDQLQAIYNKLNASTRWCRGHSGVEHNERADVLAGEARLSKGTST